MQKMIPVGTVVTVRTTNGGEMTAPLAFNYRPTYDVVLRDTSSPGAMHIAIWAGRIRSVEPVPATKQED